MPVHPRWTRNGRETPAGTSRSGTGFLSMDCRMSRIRYSGVDDEVKAPTGLLHHPPGASTDNRGDACENFPYVFEAAEVAAFVSRRYGCHVATYADLSHGTTLECPGLAQARGACSVLLVRRRHGGTARAGGRPRSPRLVRDHLLAVGVSVVVMRLGRTGRGSVGPFCVNSSSRGLVTQMIVTPGRPVRLPD